MILMAILLLVSTIFLFHKDWNESLPQPAYCLFQSIQGNIIASDSVFWMACIAALLLHGYASAIIPLFPEVYAPIRGFGKKWLRQSLKRFFRWSTKDTTKHSRLRDRTAKILSFLVSDPLRSLYFDTFWFAGALSNLFDDRDAGSRKMDPSKNNDQSAWGFGQLLPMFLIFLPIVTVFEIFYGIWSIFWSRA